MEFHHRICEHVPDFHAPHLSLFSRHVSVAGCHHLDCGIALIYCRQCNRLAICHGENPEALLLLNPRVHENSGYGVIQWLKQVHAYQSPSP